MRLGIFMVTFITPGSRKIEQAQHMENHAAAYCNFAQSGGEEFFMFFKTRGPQAAIKTKN